MMIRKRSELFDALPPGDDGAEYFSLLGVILDCEECEVVPRSEPQEICPAFHVALEPRHLRQWNGSQSGHEKYRRLPEKVTFISTKGILQSEDFPFGTIVQIYFYVGIGKDGKEVCVRGLRKCVVDGITIDESPISEGLATGKLPAS